MQNSGVSYYDECLTLGQWLSQEDSRALYKYLLVKNSAVKENLTEEFYNNYITPIKKIINNSGLECHYEEFKTARFYKSVDLIFTITLIKIIRNSCI